jgi:aminoglycoside phosphotransferase (APT) family kinase protein
VWRFGDVVFRFPRRQVAVPLIRTELQVLPFLASQLPVAIPTPTLVGVPSTAFPFPFYGHPFLVGTTGDRAALDDAGRAAAVPALAGFLRALHAINPVDAGRLNVKPDVFRGDTPRSAERALSRLSFLEGTPFAGHLDAIRARLSAPPPPDDSGTAVVLHGDLYARHLLLDDTGHLSGVIDWGDVCTGDRAVDLAVAYTFLPPAHREAFFEAYGPVDPATRERARFIGLARHGVHLAAYAHDVDDAPLAREAIVALEHLFA